MSEAEKLRQTIKKQAARIKILEADLRAAEKTIKDNLSVAIDNESALKGEIEVLEGELSEVYVEDMSEAVE